MPTVQPVKPPVISVLKKLRATPHHSKCRYGERGAADAKPKAQIILDAAKVSAASGGNSEPKQGQRSQSARGFCPPKHDAGTATRHYRAFWQRRCRAAAAGAVLKPQGGNCAVLPRISPDQTKSAQPRRQAGAARLCAKAKSLLFFLCFCLRNQNGVRSFCTADPVVLAPCLDCSDYSILPKFCKHFLSASGGFFSPIALFY